MSVREQKMRDRKGEWGKIETCESRERDMGGMRECERDMRERGR